MAVQGDDYECDDQTADITGGGLRAVSHDRRCPSCPSRPLADFPQYPCRGLDLAHPARGYDVGHVLLCWSVLGGRGRDYKEFQALDGDHDGFISREDAKNWPELSRVFDKFDTDHDGRLSHNDFKAFEKAPPAQ